MLKRLLIIALLILCSSPALATTFTIIIAGQSNGGQMVCPYIPGATLVDGCGTATANANVKVWDSSGASWYSPGTGSGYDSVGATALGNAINNATGWTVHIVNISFGSSSIFQETDGGFGYWWNSNNTPSSYYATQKAKVVAATGGSADAIVLMNGENEGFKVYPSTYTGTSSPNTWTQSWYVSKYSAFLAQLQTDFGVPLIIQSQLATDSNLVGGYGLDDSWSNMREFNKAAVAAFGGHTYIGDCTVNYALGSSGVHWTSAGYAKAGQMLAQTILYDKGYVSWYKAPTITGLNAVDSTHTDINIQHSGGTDFTPTSSITGFAETCDGSALTISAAVRQTASSIRLTHGSCSGTRIATYMYGMYPNVAGVVDNSNLTYPLEPSINITQGSGDTTPPTVSITQSSPQAISSNSLTVTGTASDDTAVTGCKYRIGSEPDATHGTTCTGTTSWSCATSGYSSGANTLYVECYDAVPNYSTGHSITVNYTPTLSPQYGISLKGAGIFE